MGNLHHDLSFGLRSLIRTPVATLAMLGTLAVGIGGGTTVFTIINAEILQPLPYAEGLVEVVFEIDGSGRNLSAPNVADLREQVSSFVAITGFDDRKVFNFAGGDEPVRVYGASADAHFFETLGVRPVLGRMFLPEDDQPGADLVVVLGEEFWRGRLGGDPDILGRSIRLNDRPYTVVGIAPSSLEIPSREELWVPLATHPYGDERLQQRGSTILETVARLRPGVELAEARTELEAISNRLASEYPDSNEGTRFVATDLHEALLGNRRELIAALAAAVGAVFLLACVTVATLQINRAVARRRELGVRLALGATRARLTRQLLTEALLLSLAAGALGVAVAVWSRQTLLYALPGLFPRLTHIGLDGAVLGFAAVSAGLVTVLSGLGPALFVSPERLTVGNSNAASAGRGQRLLRSGLVIVEISLALALLVNAGLLARTLVYLDDVDSGYDPEGVLTASLSLPESRYDGDAAVRFFTDLVGNLERLGGVESVAAINRLPVTDGTNIASFFIEGRDQEYEAASHVRMISPRYFETLGIPLVAGRLFIADEISQGQPVVIIDAEFAARHWPDGDPVGGRVRPGVEAPWFQIVGVVGATRHWGPRFDPEPTIYVPHTTVPQHTMMVALRGEEPLQRVADLRQAVWAIDPDLPVEQIRTMTQALVATQASSRTSAAVFGLFSAFALMLAVLGVYGLLGQTVAQRTREVGIRLAIGANRRSIRRLILTEGTRIALVGIAIGLALAAAASHAVASQLHGVAPLDPLTFAGVAALMLITALLAAAVPARRATRIDPVRSLKAD